MGNKEVQAGLGLSGKKINVMEKDEGDRSGDPDELAFSSAWD